MCGQNLGPGRLEGCSMCIRTKIVSGGACQWHAFSADRSEV
jgi:hypothetical protein